MWTCPHCGHIEPRPQAAFCTECGAALHATPPALEAMPAPAPGAASWPGPVVVPPVIAPPATEVATADFGFRALAAYIDWMIVGTATSVLVSPFSFWYMFGQMRDVWDQPAATEPAPFHAFAVFPLWLWVAGPIVGVVVQVAYDLAMLRRSRHATVGMRVVGLRVEAVGGGPPANRQAFVRTLVKAPIALSLPGMLWALASVLVLLRDPERGCPHDRASGTRVVRERPVLRMT